MKKLIGLSVACLAAFSLVAAPGKVEPVAEGYPDWQGVIDKNHLHGRFICPSDLRQRTVVIYETDVNSTALQQHLEASLPLMQLTGLAGNHFGANWEDRELPRECLVLHVVRGAAKNLELLEAALKPPKNVEESRAIAFSALNGEYMPYYDNVTFTGAPDAEGKYPYVYVLGSAGKDPLFKGEANINGIKSAIDAAKKDIAKNKTVTWKPFYGTVSEPQFWAKQMEKAVAKGKIGMTAKDIMKGTLDKNVDKAKESQILYDAINQTRSDLIMRIKMEARACPHRAFYDIKQLLKYWPSEKKKIDAQMQIISQIPGAMALCQMFAQVMEWANPTFIPKNAGDAKTIVAKLNKMKKQLVVMRESKNMIVQNGALLLDTQLDQLVSDLPSRVPAK